MKYTKFTIENYKGIPKIELDLSKKPGSNIFTLVGLNESGKTTLLEAIYLFQNSIKKKDAHTLIPKNKQHEFNGEISIKAELELSSEDLKEIKINLEKEHKFHLTDSNTRITVIKNYKFLNSVPDESKWKAPVLWDLPLIGKTKQAKKKKILYDWNKQVWLKTVDLIKQKNLPKILYYRDFLFQFPEKIYLEQHSGEGAEQKEYRNVIQDVLYSIDKNLTTEKHLLERMKNKNQASHSEALGQLLLKMESKLNNEILSRWDSIFGTGKQKEVMISDGFEGNETKKYFIKLKIKQGANSYSINDRSLGFRWFFSFLIFTAFRKSRIEDPGETLFLLDEPASNLHQGSQQKLLQSLEKIFSECKLIYSTHSHHLINPKWLAGTYIIKNKAINYDVPEEASATETNISATLYKNFVSEYPEEQDHFKPILDSLDYTPSQLEMVPSIVFTEGKNDYYIFKYMMKMIFKEEHKLNFYPGAGVNKYDIPFRLYLAWNKKFIALFDSDSGGKTAKKSYIESIGRDIKNKILTFEDINPQWKNLKTEQLFSENEKINIIKTCFNDYETENGYDEEKDKSKFNTAMQGLYIQNKTHKFEKETLDKFKKILDFLQKKLSEIS